MSYQSQTSLQIIAVTFTLFKALEYSVREYTQEMVYVSLDYESRFIGKEIIGLFVNRAGKSTMAVGLSLATNFFGSSSSGLDQMFVQALSVSSLFWLLASYPLAHGKEKST
jgi:ATP/ADP translocase